MNALQNNFIGFVKLFDFSLQNRKQMYLYKQKICIYKETEYISRGIYQNRFTKFQRNIFVLSVLWQKKGKADDITFWKVFFWFFSCADLRINIYFRIPSQNCARLEILWKKIEFQGFASFALSLNWYCVKCKNERHHRILRPKWTLKLISHDTSALFS